MRKIRYLVPILVIAVAAGCGKQSDHITTPTKSGDSSTEGASDTPQADAPTCPDDVALWLVNAWNIPDNQIVDAAYCASGSFPEPALAVSAWLIPADRDEDLPDLYDYRLQIVSADGAVIVEYAGPDDDDPRAWLNGRSPKVEAVDLDGDGAAELLLRYDWIGREDSETSHLDAYRRDGDKLVEAGGVLFRNVDPQLGRGGDSDDPNNPYLIECTASVKVLPPDAGKRALELTWTVKEGANAKGTCPSGVELIDFIDGTLVKRS